METKRFARPGVWAGPQHPCWRASPLSPRLVPSCRLCATTCRGSTATTTRRWRCVTTTSEPNIYIYTIVHRCEHLFTRHYFQWQDHLGNRSFSSVERAGAAAIAVAEASIGEFHLKSRPGGEQGPTQPRLDPAPLQETHLHLFITRQEVSHIQTTHTTTH